MRQPARALALIVVAFALSVLLGLLDFWGASVGSQAASTRIALSVFAPWYSWRFPAADAAGDAVSIVLIDEAAIARRDTTYPLPYTEQEELIQSITFRLGTDDQFVQPAALFLDLVYADDRGVRERRLVEEAWDEGVSAALASLTTAAGEAQPAVGNNNLPAPDFIGGGDIATFGETLAIEAEDGTLVGARAPAMHRASPPLAIEYAGVLVADEVGGEGIAATLTDDPGSLYGRLNRVEAPAAPSRMAPGPLRYALAPEGSPSPALKLAIWACAAAVPERHVPGCAFDDASAPIVDPQAIRRAAHAAALADVAASCARTRASTLAELRAVCERTALRHAAGVGWAPVMERARKQTSRSPQEEHAQAMLVRYAAARRDGHFEGALAGTACLDYPEAGRGSTVEVAGATEPEDVDRARAACREAADRHADARLGPTMTVLWGASPRDGGLPRGAQWPDGQDYPDGPAAPYTWRAQVEANGDPCQAFRFGSSLPERASESLLRARNALLAFVGWPIDSCAYHTAVQLDWLTSDHPKTTEYVDWAVADRVVMVGASVAGAEGMQAMRGVYAPSVWAHAMAFDNLLTLGADYRRATLDGAGFGDDWEATVVGITRDGIITWAIALTAFLFLSKTKIKSSVSHIFPKTCDRYVISTVLEITIGLAFALLLSLPIALIILSFTTWPPLDWLAVGGAAAAAWALTSEHASET